MQVSRTKTWRKPLLVVDAEAADFAAAAEVDADAVLLGVTARNAMNLPEALIEGRMPSVPTSAPLGSVEMSRVDGEHCDWTPAQVSRR